MNQIPAALRLSLVLGLSALATGCGSKLDGTYTNPTGIVMLELRSGGKATMGMGGETKDCTWEEQKKQVLLLCARDRLTLRVNEDGSLFAPGFVGVMRKAR